MREADEWRFQFPAGVECDGRGKGKQYPMPSWGYPKQWRNLDLTAEGAEGTEIPFAQLDLSAISVFSTVK